MRVTILSAFRRAAIALALLLLASVTALSASAQYGPAYYPPGPGYYPNNGMWNNASYYVYQNNPSRNRNAPNVSTDFGYAVIPPPAPAEDASSESEETTAGRMYLYNFTGGAGPVYENPSEPRNLHCFPC